MTRPRWKFERDEEQKNVLFGSKWKRGDRQEKLTIISRINGPSFGEDKPALLCACECGAVLLAWQSDVSRKRTFACAPCSRAAWDLWRELCEDRGRDLLENPEVELEAFPQRPYGGNIKASDRQTVEFAFSDSPKSDVAKALSAGGIQHWSFAVQAEDSVDVLFYSSEREAKIARAREPVSKRKTESRTTIGAPVRFRVVAVYANGVERDLSAFDVSKESETYDRGVGFVTDDEEFCVFVARRPRADSTAADEPQTIHDEMGAPF